MREFYIILSFIFSAFFFISCASTPPNQQEIRNAAKNIGDYPKNYQSLIRQYNESRIFDPYSAKYKFAPPRKGWFKDEYNKYETNQEVIGVWIVQYSLNAKNRMGGYVGSRERFDAIYNGKVIDEIISRMDYGKDWGLLQKD